MPTTRRSKVYAQFLVKGWCRFLNWLADVFFFFSSRRRHTRFDCDWSSDVCSSDLVVGVLDTRFDATPGIVYAAGVEHAYNLAREFRAAGLKAEAVSGRTPPLQLAETLAAYERGEINVLINAQLLAEGWNSPRATVCMHLAPTASRRVYQQRIGRVMRTHPRKEAGVVVDFVDPAATHNDRTITIHSLLDSDFYRPGARVTPAPRRRVQRRARRKLSP